MTEMEQNVPAFEIGREPNILAPFSDRKDDESSDEATRRKEIAELVAQAQGGDCDAFGRVYVLCYKPIFRLAQASLGPEAEEAVADTFLRAWSSLPRYRDTGAPFVAWLYGIARHVVADHLRTRQRVEPRAELPETWTDKSPDDRIALGAAIARLPKRQRQVVEMKYLMGLTNPEVAVALGISVGAVNAKQWRALKNLGQMLEAQ